MLACCEIEGTVGFERLLGSDFEFPALIFSPISFWFRIFFPAAWVQIHRFKKIIRKQHRYLVLQHLKQHISLFYKVSSFHLVLTFIDLLFFSVSEISPTTAIKKESSSLSGRAFSEESYRTTRCAAHVEWDEIKKFKNQDLIWTGWIFTTLFCAQLTEIPKLMEINKWCPKQDVPPGIQYQPRKAVLTGRIDEAGILDGNHRGSQECLHTVHVLTASPETSKSKWFKEFSQDGNINCFWLGYFNILNSSLQEIMISVWK